MARNSTKTVRGWQLVLGHSMQSKNGFSSKGHRGQAKDLKKRVNTYTITNSRYPSTAIPDILEHRSFGDILEDNISNGPAW